MGWKGRVLAREKGPLTGGMVVGGVGCCGEVGVTGRWSCGVTVIEGEMVIKGEMVLAGEMVSGHCR